MNIIIIGCGRIGADLAFRLYQQGHQVTVVDNMPQAFERLNPEFRGRTVEGEALAKEVLERAGIEQADGLAAVTNSDPLNAVVAHIARTFYKMQNIVVRNYDPNLRRVQEEFGFQIVSSTSWGAQRTEELLVNTSQRAVFSPGNGEVEVYEFIIPENWARHTLGELMSGVDACFPVALTKAGCSSLPAADVVLETGDVIAVSATAQGVANLRYILDGREA